jgi:propanol-preferring alcohol dehydrogenase
MVGTEKQMEELLQHALAGDIVPEAKVLEFEEVGNVIEDLKKQQITGRVVINIP